MISVTIVDGERGVRDSLQRLINSTGDCRCVGTFADAETAITGIRSLRPNVVLIDVGLPSMSGIDCVKVLKREQPELNVIMLSDQTDDEHLFQALRAGACGYLSKNVFPSKLLGAIREARQGGAPMEAAIARRVVASFQQVDSDQSDLSKREHDVLRLLCEGKSYNDMARRLFVSPNTIRFHLKNIYKKLCVSSRHEAVIKAARAGLVG